MSDDSHFISSRSRFLDLPWQNTCCVGNRNECSFLADEGCQTVGWGKQPPNDVMESLVGVYLLPSAAQIRNGRLPEFLSNCTALRFLQCPAAFLSQFIEPAPELERIKTLSIHFDGMEDAEQLQWPGCAISGLSGLSCIGDGAHLLAETGLTAEQLPQLDFFQGQIGRNARMLSVVAGFDQLQHIELSAVGTADIFPHIAGTVKVLGIRGAGRDFSLSGITELQSLEAVRLVSVKSEVNCELLLKLPNLLEINFNRCKRLFNVNSLLNSKQLRSVTLVDCGGPLKREGQQLFREHGFKHLNVKFS